MVDETAILHILIVVPPAGPEQIVQRGGAIKQPDINAGSDGNSEGVTDINFRGDSAVIADVCYHAVTSTSLAGNQSKQKSFQDRIRTVKKGENVFPAGVGHRF